MTGKRSISSHEYKTNVVVYWTNNKSIVSLDVELTTAVTIFILNYKNIERVGKVFKISLYRIAWIKNQMMAHINDFTRRTELHLSKILEYWLRVKEQEYLSSWKFTRCDDVKRAKKKYSMLI